MQESMVNLLKKMLEIYSPTGRELELSHFLSNEFKTLGFKTHIDMAGNTIGEFGKGKPTILLCGHMDTVSGRLQVTIENGRIYGRGAVDAKSPLAAMITAASMLIKEDFSGKITVAAVVDEEGKGCGVKQLIHDNVKADYAIFGEPSGIKQLTIAYKGSLHLEITVRTITGHSSVPWLYENAVEKAFEIYGLIREISFPLEKQDSKFYSTTSCLTQIEGGSLSSTVPSICKFHVDFRFPPNVKTEKLFEEIKRAVDRYVKNKKFSVSIEVIDSCESYEVDTASILVRALSWAIRMVEGKPATWVRKTGTGDMNLYGASILIPVVTYGVGESSMDHTSMEWVDLKEYDDSIRVLYNGLKKLLELYNKKDRNKKNR